MSNPKIRPNRWYYALPILIFIFGMIIFFVISLSSIIDKNTRVVIPGKSDIVLKDTGTYTIYNEYRSVIDGKIYYTPQDISGLQCRLISKGTGESINIYPPRGYSKYTFGSYEGVSVFSFNIEQPGVYELSGEYPAGKGGSEMVLSVSHGSGGEFIVTLFIAMFEMFASFIVSVVLFIIILMKRQKAIKALGEAGSK